MYYLREKAIEQQLIRAVKAAGGIAYKFVSPGRLGVPDRLVVLPGGRVLFVECKAPGQKARPSQQREHNRLRALGCEVITLDSKNISEIV
ncbi:VRR-NUC domain-containing protein [Candidatus Sodalis sp. SoCistrobi]|uniref:VRR-NUC domain-containing protein n=1 Tax=Candidatus Sodalis sp. SoCistrobi TaxID=1922216 RepID=UPI00093B89A0|nr:VRR-NUC domain-containing protein [Candidatus Sodalis sp. SoCistrobi]